jgi:hypothetical protein
MLFFQMVFVMLLLIIPIPSLGLKSPNNIYDDICASFQSYFNMRMVLDQDYDIVYKSPYKQVNHGVP